MVAEGKKENLKYECGLCKPVSGRLHALCHGLPGGRHLAFLVTRIPSLRRLGRDGP